MLKLPENVQEYSATPVFNQDTVPKALLKDHNTKAGTWGLLTVEKGKLRYIVTEPNFEEEVIVNAGSTAVIAPGHLHYVEPLGEVQFFVAFHR